MTAKRVHHPLPCDMLVKQGQQSVAPRGKKTGKQRPRQLGLAATVFAAVGLLSSKSYAQFAGGAGTEADPYQIATVEQLDSVRSSLSAHFVLTADIDLDVSPYNTGSGWEPIGTGSLEFSGSFNGNGHTIDNLFIDKGGR